MASFTLNDLAARVKERAAASAETSYTRKLLDKGVAHCAKKLGEEAVETALAAVGESRERLIADANPEICVTTDQVPRPSLSRCHTAGCWTAAAALAAVVPITLPGALMAK